MISSQKCSSGAKTFQMENIFFFLSLSLESIILDILREAKAGPLSIRPQHPSPEYFREGNRVYANVHTSPDPHLR